LLLASYGQGADREAEAGFPGGSRNLLSLQGGHAGNDTSAHHPLNQRLETDSRR
jgi:hypothetical protein